MNLERKGWECPKCARVNSPDCDACPCSPGVITGPYVGPPAVPTPLGPYKGPPVAPIPLGPYAPPQTAPDKPYWWETPIITMGSSGQTSISALPSHGVTTDLTAHYASRAHA